MLTNLVRTKLKAHEIHDSWDTLRTQCNRIHRVTTKFYQSEEHLVLMKRDQNLSPFLKPVFEIMDLKYDPNDTMLMGEIHMPIDRKHDPEATASWDEIPLPSEPKKPPDRGCIADSFRRTSGSPNGAARVMSTRHGARQIPAKRGKPPYIHTA